MPNLQIPQQRATQPEMDADFALAVRLGLGTVPRSLPQIWHYDALGSSLFEAICLLPEYDLTRLEDAVLGSFAGDVIGRFGPPAEILELGSGVASKTVSLLQAGARVAPGLRYRPIDISAAALASAQRRLQATCPGVGYAPLQGDYTELLQTGLPPADGKRLVLFLGSNIGNYQGSAGVALLQAIHAALAPGDGLLVGAALRRPRAELIAAYDDAVGVTAAFNRNVLARINTELGGTFNVRDFTHVVEYDEHVGVVESYLQAGQKQRVRIEALNMDCVFEAGDRIHTESSCKYTRAGVAELGTAAGFRFVGDWTDDAERFCDALFVVA